MSSNFTFTGSVVYLRNKGFPSPSSETEGSCEITVANETYIEFIAFQFEVKSQNVVPLLKILKILVESTYWFRIQDLLLITSEVLNCH